MIARMGCVHRAKGTMSTDPFDDDVDEQERRMCCTEGRIRRKVRIRQHPLHGLAPWVLILPLCSLPHRARGKQTDFDGMMTIIVSNLL